MQVAKWGNSLAVRLPKPLVQRLGLKAGDRVEVTAIEPNILEIAQGYRAGGGARAYESAPLAPA